MSDAFRWRGFFQHSRDAVFVLNRSRKLVFANRAFEALSGVAFTDARGLTCTRRATGHSLASLGRTLAPPPDVLRGHTARAQRPRPGEEIGPPWWEIEYLPLTDADGLLGIVGRVTPTDPQDAAAARVMLEPWAAVRAEAVERYRLDAVADGCPTLKGAVELARLAAQSGASVSLIGEPGTGKRWLARSIHHAGPRRLLPFVALDCAALPFDAVRGVLMGPLGPGHPAWLGTLYLHAPDALPESLRRDVAEQLVEGGVGFAVGYDAEPAMSLGVLPIHLSPLRARAADLPWLVDVFVMRAAATLGRKPPALSADALACVRAYAWPGNLRELAATLFAASAQAGDAIEATDLPVPVRQARSAVELPARRAEPMPKLDEVLEQVEKRLIALALAKAGGNQSQAAELLGVWRPRLLRRIKALGLNE